MEKPKYVVFKYLLKIDRLQDIYMPRRAVLLHVGELQGKLVLWAMFQESEAFTMVPRRIAVIGTGYAVPENTITSHVGTVVMSDCHVWHVFDNGEAQ